MVAKDSSQIEDLENELFARMKPVQPRTEFVDHLRHHLENPPGIVIEKPSWKEGALILGGSLVIGFVIYALLRKIARWMSR